jgi:hypothetical protein
MPHFSFLIYQTVGVKADNKEQAIKAVRKFLSDFDAEELKEELVIINKPEGLKNPDELTAKEKI